MIVVPWKDDVITLAMAQLTEFQPTNDYFELLELTIIFLGAIPPSGIHFCYPGAHHRASWMARVIYSLKMWLFCSEYPLQQQSKTLRGSYQKMRGNI